MCDVDIELVAVVVDVVERICDGDIERDAIVIVATHIELERLVIIICVDGSSSSCGSMTSRSPLLSSTSLTSQSSGS